LIQLLMNLNGLIQDDHKFAEQLRTFPFVPNDKGDLCQPCKLYDPHNLDLVALLDLQTCFPSAPFCLNTAALLALQQLGLRQHPGPDTLLEAARYVERLWLEAVEYCSLEGMDMAVARGKALLAFLEMESDRIARHPSLDPSPRPSQPSRPSRPQGVLAGAPALVGRLGLGLLSRVSDVLVNLQGSGHPHMIPPQGDLRAVVGETDVLKS